MRTFLTAIISLIALASFKMGEPLATLTCKSQSGRTTFTAELPSCSYLEKAELSIDGSKLNFARQDRTNIIFDPDNKVFTIFLQSESDEPLDYKFLKFWAIPSTFKKVRGDKGPGSQFQDIYEFHARLYATEPRKSQESNTKTIELICTLEYQL